MKADQVKEKSRVLYFQGVTISEIARRSGMSRRQIQRWKKLEGWQSERELIAQKKVPAFRDVLIPEAAPELVEGKKGVAKRRRKTQFPKVRGGQPGWIYFIADSSQFNVKIGFSTDVSKRLAQLQSGSPVKLRLLCVIPGTWETERFFHKTFATSRLEGEWFEMNYSLKAMIDLFASTPLDFFSDYQQASLLNQPFDTHETPTDWAF